MSRSENLEHGETAAGPGGGNDRGWQATIPVVAVYGMRPIHDEKTGKTNGVPTQGSALVVGPNLLLTAYHVVEGMGNLRIRVPDPKERNSYLFLDATRIAADEDQDLALLKPTKPLNLTPAVLVGDLKSDDLEELNQFHSEKLLKWQCFGFPGAIENQALKDKSADPWHDQSVVCQENIAFGKPTPYQIEKIVPTETSPSDGVSLRGTKLAWTDLPHGESGGAMLAYAKQPDGTYEWFGLGLNRLGGDGAASSSIRLFEKSQAVFTSKTAQIKLHGKDDLLKAFGLDLDSVLMRRSQRCREKWEQTWSRLDLVGNPDDESRWLAFYVPPNYSKLSRPEPRAGKQKIDPVDYSEIDKNTYSTATAAGGKPNDGWEPVPGTYEEERLANLLKPQHLVVFEGPGAGKTIFTRRVEAYFSSQPGQRLQGNKPLLVIRQAHWGESNWSSAFEKDLLDDAKGCKPYARRLVEQAKKHGRLVWILDALDQLSDQTRDATLSSIRETLLSEDGKQIRVIVTSRPGAVREQLGKFLQPGQQAAAGIDWHYARIEPFTVQQQYRYLYGPEEPSPQALSFQDAWSIRKLDWNAIDRHRIVPRVKGTDDARIINSIALEVSNYGDERIQQLMSNPAILAMIRGLAQGGALPKFDRRADLYKEVSRRMINRALSKLPIDHAIDAARIEEILAALAFASMLTDPSNHEFRGDAVRLIRDRASKRLAERVHMRDWNVVDQMPGNTSRSFLLSSMERELRWSHKGVMEFYCGQFLSYNSDPKWCPDQGQDDGPVGRDRMIWKIAANPQWEEAFRFAIELGLSTEPNARNEDVLLASLGMLYEEPSQETGWERPTRLMFEAWSLLEKLPRRDWCDAIEPIPLERGRELIERYRRQFQRIKDDSSHQGYKVAQAMLGNFRPCPPTGNDNPEKLRFKIGDDLADATIDSAFELNAFAVTNQEYELFDAGHVRVRKFTRSVPQNDDLGRHPVVKVSWYSAWCFCKWLGDGCRLPNEKEWEYACRAGSVSLFHVGKNLRKTDANFDRHFSTTTPVGCYTANSFALHDMHGNVWEWCANWCVASIEESLKPEYRPGAGYSARALRGGSWGYYARYCRSACRYNNIPSSHTMNVGFRVAKEWS